jgi:hypothetical protein
MKSIQAKPNWSKQELALLKTLHTPALIQKFLDAVPYSSESIYRSPRSVLRDGKAHCFDGAVFAAACLERIGYPPLILELKAVRDDDHLMALYRIDSCWGAVAKSNFVGLRYREPIYRSLRELAISYFSSFFNVESQKTLRAYSAPLKLARFEHWNWWFNDEAMDRIAEKLDNGRHYALLSARQIACLVAVDPRTYQGEMTGTDPTGLYRPVKKSGG